MRKIGFIAIAVSLFLPVFWGFSQTISISGSWALTISALDLLNGPGSGLPNSFESASDQVLVTISKANKNWRVDVSRSDLYWPNEWRLDVRRTGTGQGPGILSGGTEYSEITGAAHEFFRGRKQKSWIPLQFRLRGTSIETPASTYHTTVVYTLIEM